MGDFNAFLDALKQSLNELAHSSFDNYSKQLVQDGTEFARRLEGDLQSWSAEYSIHEITKEEFEELVKSQKDLLEMEELKKEDLPRTELNKMRNAIVDTVTAAAVKSLL
jgi:cysteinyl-tRNA synthetase